MPEHDPLHYRFACTQCGRCCRWPGEVRLTGADIARLSRGANLTELSWIERFTRLAHGRDGLSLLDSESGACVFLSGDLCTVYDNRPEQCRRFPFAHTTPEECPGLTACDLSR